MTTNTSHKSQPSNLDANTGHKQATHEILEKPNDFAEKNYLNIASSPHIFNMLQQIIDMDCSRTQYAALCSLTHQSHHLPTETSTKTKSPTNVLSAANPTENGIRRLPSYEQVFNSSTAYADANADMATYNYKVTTRKITQSAPQQQLCSASGFAMLSAKT